MTKIEPIDFIETTALKEREQLRNAVNGVIGEINGAAEDASAAAASALKAEQEATRSAEFAHAAQTAADAAAGDAAKVNQFDARIKSNLNAIAFAGSYDAVTATVTKESGVSETLAIPNVDHGHAGMMTPAQMQEITEQIDTLGRDQDAIKRDYLKRHDVVNEQDITGRVDFKISPFVPVLKHNEYEDHGGTRALNPASARADPVLMKTIGIQDINTLVRNVQSYQSKSTKLDITNLKTEFQYGSFVDLVDQNDTTIGSIFDYSAKGDRMGLALRLYMPGPISEGETRKNISIELIGYTDGKSELIFKRPDGTVIPIIPKA